MFIKLQKLLGDLITIPPAWNVEISGLALDSRKVEKGQVFFACLGTKTDGREYLQQAIDKGAAAIIYEKSHEKNMLVHDQAIPIIGLENLVDVIGLLAARFYQEPAKDLQIIGVTGTNGKTSCTQFLAKILEEQKIPCAVIGTLGNGMIGHLQSGTHTTPNAIELQQLLSQFKQQGAKAVTMEVSSHGLAQGRANHIPFSLAIFTNLTHDHLDYHGTMQNYALAKKRLFEFPTLKACIINADDEFGRQLIQEFSHSQSVFAYSVAETPPTDINCPLVKVRNIRINTNGMQAEVATPWGKGKLQTRLLGRFNLSNLAAVLTAALVMDIPLESVLERISNLQGVPGRMEVFGGNNQPLVVVDYAHTPDALRKVLTAVREHSQGRLWCVFGCGGDRDRAKRPIMGGIAEQCADRVVLTNDNPRSEPATRIIADIIQGINHKDAIIVEHDRDLAIDYAIKNAQINDIIVVAGKGHENYQQIGDKKIPFNDVDEVKKFLKARQP